MRSRTWTLRLTLASLSVLLCLSQGRAQDASGPEKAPKRKGLEELVAVHEQLERGAKKILAGGELDKAFPSWVLLVNEERLEELRKTLKEQQVVALRNIGFSLRLELRFDRTIARTSLQASPTIQPWPFEVTRQQTRNTSEADAWSWAWQTTDRGSGLLSSLKSLRRLRCSFVFLEGRVYLESLSEYGSERQAPLGISATDIKGESAVLGRGIVGLLKLTRELKNPNSLFAPLALAKKVAPPGRAQKLARNRARSIEKARKVWSGLGKLEYDELRIQPYDQYFFAYDEKNQARGALKGRFGFLQGHLSYILVDFRSFKD